MNPFAQLQITDDNGNQQDLLGSDGFLPLDGRYSLNRCIDAVYEQVSLLQNVQPHITGFEIRRGDLRTSHVIHTSKFPSVVDKILGEEFANVAKGVVHLARIAYRTQNAEWAAEFSDKLRFQYGFNHAAQMRLIARIGIEPNSWDALLAEAKN